MSTETVLEVSNVSKMFGATHALSDVTFQVHKGAVHSLVGKNGAGKSTLVNTIAGVIRQDTGSIRFEGNEISHLSMKERQDVGIRLVTQHASVIPDLSVAENISLGLWQKNRVGLVSWQKVYGRAREVMDKFGLEVDPYRLVRHLTPVECRKLNIIRALFGGGKLIILDEPTTSLSAEDRSNLFNFVKSQAEKGITFIFISHYLEEILQISDDITAVRDGIVYPGMRAEANSQENLARIIAGENVELVYRDPGKVPSKDILLECNNVTASFVKGVSVKVNRGEIVGFVGFPGSGAQEICTAMYGLNKMTSGSVRVGGRKLDTNSPEKALKGGICYVPNDRHTDGIVPIMPIDENIGLSSLSEKLSRIFGLLKLGLEHQIAEDHVKNLKIKAASSRALVSSLSGGNQQKVVLAKVLTCEPKLLILDEPTIGIDVKSREEIIGLIKGLSKEGMSVIYVTNDYEELLRIADRVVVFRNGRIVTDVMNERLTTDDVKNFRDQREELVS